MFRRNVSPFLTLSPPIPLRLYILPYWSNPPFIIFDIRALWRSGQTNNFKNLKNGGLDQYCAKPVKNPVKQEQFGTAGVEGVKF